MFLPPSIADFLGFQHFTALNRAAAAEEIKKPYLPDPSLELLIKLGNAHEQAHLIKLRDEGLSVVKILTDGSHRDAAARTIEVIQRGADAVYQPTFLAMNGMGARTFSGESRSPAILDLLL